MGAAFAIVSMIMTMASAAASARAQYIAGKQAQQNAEYNAQVAEDAAAEEKDQRAIEAVAERNESRSRLASMEARYAKTGLLMAGTPELFIEKQAEADEFNILTRDRASEMRATNLMTEAEIQRAYGEDARSSAKTNMQITLLSGAASAAGQAYSYQSNVGPRNDGGELSNPSLMGSVSKPKMGTLANSGVQYNSMIN